MRAPSRCYRTSGSRHRGDQMIGTSVKRRKDERFLTGRGRYVDDLRVPGALHLAVVRGVHAHARIVSIDSTRARGIEGVVAAFTLDDLPELREVPPPPPVAAVSLEPYRQSALADGIVRFAGEPVAVVAATSAYAAADGAAAVAVEYEPRPAAIDPERAGGPDAPLVHPEWATNVAATVSLAFGDADAALRGADLVVTRRFRFGRMSAVPMEPRAVAARWDAVTGTLHLWSTAQIPYVVAQRVAEALRVPVGAVRVTAPDVGGGFGCKGPVYPEEVIAATLARRLGRPVRWTETRGESFVSTTHASGQIHEATLALGRDGTFLALVDDFVVDAGAYLPRGGVVANVTATHLPGLYRFGAFRCRGRLAARRAGRRLGFGMATYNEATAVGSHEGASVTIEADGRVSVTIGPPSQGQGHETVMAQVCAERLSVSVDDVTVSGGDTARF